MHALDITVGLVIDKRLPNDRLRVLTRMGSPRAQHPFFGVDLDGNQQRADDLDWTFGRGSRHAGRRRI